MKKQNLTLSLALSAMFSSSVALAVPTAEISGKIVHESATFTSGGIGIGAATTSSQTSNSHGSDVFKTATHARVFVDGELDELHEGATFHVEVNGFYDDSAVDDNDSEEDYTSRDILREAYIDADVEGISIRAGKQQVVWGTADGMKLLDAINPTDYSEMAQDQMEDSRIPVWMINAEADTPNGGSFQVIVAESRSSHFAGLGNPSKTMTTLHDNGDQGNAFVMKGTDTITGRVNGFLNLAPALGKAARAFHNAMQGGDLTGQKTGTVGHFADSTNTSTNFEGTCSGGSDAQCLADITHLVSANEGTNAIPGASIKEQQNLIAKTNANTEWSTTNPNAMFEYLHQTSFSTFDNFVDLTTSYFVDHEVKPTLAARYKNSTSGGMNYTVNAIHGHDTNPYIDMQWEKPDGTKLYENLVDEGGTYSTVILSTATSGATDADAGGKDGVVANLRMSEKLNLITQIGGSFDTAIESSDYGFDLGPVVLRGEALYQNDVMSPVITRKATSKLDLEHGFMVESVKMQKGDRFKYVLGADVTVLTNMLVSAQFIQDINMDYVDVGNSSAADWKYTADMATMHITNNLNKGEEFKEFYSLFLSKPFGASGEHRWNNIFMYEDGEGMWNRLDAEFSIDDNTQVTLEWNEYFGDKNTQFGQLAASSNIQAGFKYSF
jgi:hypothetical protein